MTSQYRLITMDDPSAPASEAYRTLRMNLQFASLDQALRSLVVTSPGADEGKTTTLANLAVTLAQAEQEVILVDCDLRRPQLHRFFDLDNEMGLTNLILDETLTDVSVLKQTAVDQLRLLPSGHLPPRPADLLGSRRMGTVIEWLLEQADIVLFDAPPVLAATDAAVLSTRVDGVLLVVSAGQTRREQATQAIERLSKVNANLVGSVLANAPSSTLSSY